MPISKQTIRDIAAGVKFQSVSQEASDLLNGIIDRILEVTFPKDSSVIKNDVADRVNAIAQNVQLIANALNSLQQVGQSDGYPIPHDTVRRLIREHAGDVKVPEDTIKMVSDLIANILVQIIYRISDNVVTLDDKKLEGKHIVQLLMNVDTSLNNPPIGPLDKLKAKKKSASKKSKRRSVSKCSKSKILVRGFKRSDGKRVKAYCRKK